MVGPEAADGLRFRLLRSFQVPLASLAGDVLPDDAAVSELEAELAGGAELDEACRRIQPAYAGWSPLEQRAYRLYAMALLSQRRGADRPE